MKRKVLCCILLLVFLMTGCFDQRNVEDVSLTLILGIDLDPNDNLLVYISSPVFNKEAKIKEETTGVKSATVRKARDQFDATVMALTAGSKTQVILVGKRLLKQKNWEIYLDPFYRDPKNTVTARVVAVDGPVSDVIFYSPKDKPRLPIYLTKLVDTAFLRNITVKTTLQELYEQRADKGLTANITELKKKNKIWVTGTALLDEKGKYKLTLKPDENKLLRILQQGTAGELPFTVPIKLNSDSQDKDLISFTAYGIKVKTKARYDDHFIFNVDVKMRIGITERLFSFNTRKDAAKLQKAIETKLEADFKQLIQKIQTAKIDPIGLGGYARTYTYPKWKKIQNNWGNELAKGDVNVKVKIKIAGMGTIK
ncbi:Ger(x)C family spore germination protein [Bacillus sp. 22475]|uniref:Ger(X)C family spore germination protein n=2 Tax=Bacillus cereus group TaxID=86661 RepID=A0AAW5L503_BACCE|nr:MULTISPECIES: Ger(x)C family spore germination protein [Bacillus cereus group]PAW40783.1 Ger(x)C family spore germination protein [Bacillus toyonensis]AVP47927.1 Ger(x)C family spore germination protein [Bacillus cereus]MBZ3763701.1 Ger(x)C family spore germination protein [Bacillus cereus]MCQ6286690.1 Ger(x)C family spore germination protein [Bacillus cereus]MCQ6306760.1 Ger(x)C family spore germination protein [Bacillus cereus]